MTFSSHSMSLRMLIDVGYWQKDIVSEDSRIFLQGLVHYHGRYRVTPIQGPARLDGYRDARKLPESTRRTVQTITALGLGRGKLPVHGGRVHEG